MSDEDSSVRASSAFEDEDPNSSIIKKVRSRVSSMLPDSLSKWFSSPSSASKNSKNGSLRRRRDSTSDDDDDDDGGGEEDCSAQEACNAPPIKRKKTDDRFNASLTVFNDTSMNEAGPSGMNASVDRRQSLPTGATINLQRNKFLASTPMTSPSLLTQRQKNMVGLSNQASSPFSFAKTDHENTKIVPDAKQRRSIRESANLNTSLEVSSRKRLNIPSMSTDRSISEPPFSPYTKAGTSSGTTAPKAVRPEPNEDLIEEEEGEEEDDKMEGSKNETITAELNDSTIISNGNANETASETSSVGGRFAANLNYSQSEQCRRLSGFMGNNRIKKFRGGSTGDLCFSTHLETDKSLFAEKNNLLSQSSRPSFNASLYGSTSSLGSSNSRLFANSPFYSGRTMYGGASAYSSKRDLRMQKALRVPVQIRPSSSLSTLSSSNNSVTSDKGALSNTAQRILELMNSFSSPLGDARRMASSLNDSVLKMPGLIHNRKRFDEDDLKKNRNMRTPYNRPGSSNSNKPLTHQLQVPTISQLLQMKRLQNNTENVRKLATESTSVLNEGTEYKLPNQLDDTNNNVKHSNKIKTKLNRARPEMNANNHNQDNVPQVKLPDIQLPLMKSAPIFDIKLPAASALEAKTATAVAKPTIKSLTSTTNQNKMTKEIVQALKNSDKFKFSTPIKLNVDPLLANNNKSKNCLNFKFSEPEPMSSNEIDSDKIRKVNNKSALINSNSKLGEFKYNPDTAKPKVNNNSSPQMKSNLPLITSGSCTNVLNKPIDVPTKPNNSNSFGDQFKLTTNKWECSTCMIRNDAEKVNCVACETPKPGAKSTTTATAMSLDQIASKTNEEGFKSLLVEQSDKWKCIDCFCLKLNDADKIKCTSCGKAKPGSQTVSSSQLISPFSAPITKTTDEGFKSLVAQQSSNKWECSVCMTRNEATRSKCACCEQAKPGAAPESVPQFSFGSQPTTTSKFSFGVPKQTESNDTKTEVSKPSFSFGIPAGNLNSAPLTNETKPTTGFVFGSKSSSASVSTTEAPASFTFGSVAASSTDKPKPASTATFSFGVKPVTKDVPDNKVAEVEHVKKAEEPAKSNVFGTAASFTFGTKSREIQKPEPVSSTVKENKPAVAPGAFTFGAVATATKVEEKKEEVSTKPAFSFAQPKQVENDKVSLFGAASTVVETKPPSSAQFSFGSPATPKTDKSDVEKSRMGGFSFSSPTSTPVLVKKPETETLKPSVPIFGALSSPKTEAPSITPTFSFGAAATTSGNSSVTSTITPSFGFEGASANKPATLETAPTSAPVFSFGTGNNTQAKSAEKKIASLFGSPGNSTKKSTSTFGSFGDTQAPANASTQLFGSASPAFTFGSSVSTNNLEKPETSVLAPPSTPFAFGASATNTANPPSFGSAAAAPPVFGGNQTSSGGLPSFGSFSNTNASSNPPAFGTASAPNPFGSSTSISSFGSAGTTNATTSLFGASAPPPAFGGNNASSAFGSPSFGSPSFSSSNVQQSSDEPLAKKSSSAFEFGSASTNNQASPFAFGSNDNNDNITKPFSFTASSTPSFNFSAGSNVGQQAISSTPFTFGSNPISSGVFNFGGALTETTPNPSAFQFGAAPTNTINPFAAQNIGQNSQPRRKIRATRRVQR